MKVMGARSYAKEARPRLYPTAHIPAHTPKPGNQHEIQAHGPSLFRNDALPYITYLPYLLPYLTHLRTYLITQTSTPKPSPPKLAKSKPDNFMGRTYPHTYPHISPTPQMGPMALQGALGGSPGPLPPVDPKPPSLRGDMCGDLGDMCVQANLHVYAGSLGICAEIWGYVRPAGWVCAARGSMCAGFWGYVRDMCVR